MWQFPQFTFLTAAVLTALLSLAAGQVDDDDFEASQDVGIIPFAVPGGVMLVMWIIVFFTYGGVRGLNCVGNSSACNTSRLHTHHSLAG